jgi:hypothetical protein
MEEQEIPCQGCGKAATGKLQVSKHFTAYLCPNASACIDKMQADIMSVGRGGGGHGFGGGGGGRMVRSVGPARHFGGGRRSFGHPGFRPYYNRYYRGFLGNPMWAAYPWFRYYRYAPYDSPFWYLLSLYPLGDPFWNTFRYYPPADPYWQQYQGAVSSGDGYGDGYGINFASHLCSGEEHHPVVFSVSSEAHGAETWVLSESGVTHRQRPASQLSASLWGALVTMAECMGPNDWLDQTGQPVEDTQYRMRMNGRDYELVSTSAFGDTTQPDTYNTSDMRLLQNVVLGATTKIRDTSILFHRATHRNNSEKGTLVMASGRIYRYGVAKNDATLEEKLRGAKRLTHGVDERALGQLKQLAAHLADAPYAWSGAPIGHADKTVMLVGYDGSRPTLIMSKGRLQQHYDSEYDVNVSRKFHRLYKKSVGQEYQ